MTDLTKTIEPKSDQLNADDLLGGRTLNITITAVKLLGGDQPVAICFEGDNGKPYKPCKSMRRLMIAAWGSDGNKYVGRSMTLFCDPEVTFGKDKVGGIRISHMSDIEKPLTVALTVTKARRKPYTVQPLKGKNAEKIIISDQQAQDIKDLLKSTGTDVKAFLKHYGIQSVDEMEEQKYDKAYAILDKRYKEMAQTDDTITTF